MGIRGRKERRVRSQRKGLRWILVGLGNSLGRRLRVRRGILVEVSLETLVLWKVLLPSCPPFLLLLRRWQVRISSLSLTSKCERSCVTGFLDKGCC